MTTSTNFCLLSIINDLYKYFFLCILLVFVNSSQILRLFEFNDCPNARIFSFIFTEAYAQCTYKFSSQTLLSPAIKRILQFWKLNYLIRLTIWECPLQKSIKIIMNAEAQNWIKFKINQNLIFVSFVNGNAYRSD